ncbi:hypothetical protein [Agarivorans sp. Toyoura001]|uniref:hypothetical protein n=1 Tax=unclassified Agarivorans TaxID=2636026 RepID=UPI0010CEA65B|nr:hypothetical protein [Agarivorans sp. Toyoura001]GDY24968.1 hypothetical protein AHAT_08580 [Agarivorans sp. Toyoura001]
MPYRYYSLLCTLISISSLVSCAPQTSPIKGSFVFGHEAREFIPCGGEALWWQAEPLVTAELLEYYRANIAKPYQAIYVTVQGERLAAQVDGFASEYPAVFEINRVIDWQLTVPSNCQSPQY